MHEWLKDSDDSKRSDWGAGHLMVPRTDLDLANLLVTTQTDCGPTHREPLTSTGDPQTCWEQLSLIGAVH